MDTLGSIRYLGTELRKIRIERENTHREREREIERETGGTNQPTETRTNQQTGKQPPWPGLVVAGVLCVC